MSASSFVSRVAAGALVCILPHAASAAVVCGDATGQGHVSVTSGVAVLRAAAGLTSPCKRPICDVDLDGRIGVSDGVLTLRYAASIPSAHLTCAQAEVDRQLDRFGPFNKGGGGSGASALRVRPAGVETSPCAAGGRTDIGPDGFEDFDCNDGTTITDGRIAIADGTNGVDVTFDGFTVQHLDGEQERVVLTGALVFTEVPGDDTAVGVDGSINGSSDRVGEFSDHLQGLVVSNVPPTEGQVIGGTIRTDVTRGTGSYARLAALETTLYASGLRVAHLTLAGGATSAFVIGGESRLCETCTASDACGDGLTCRSCVGNCTGATQRCAVGDPLASCGDGDF